MKKFLFLVGCFLVTSEIVQAQLTPKYQYTYYFGGGFAAGAIFHTPLSIKWQWIYRPSELPGLPAGPIRSVYFRVGRTYGDGTPITYDCGVWVKMGSTQDTTFKDTMRFGQPYWLMKTGLTQVFFQPKVTIYGADSIGTWVRFPIDGFSYNPGMNLVVELDRGYQGFNYGFDWMLNRGCTKCALTAYYDSAWSSYNPIGYQADIGFNDATGAVGGLVNLKGFYAYPNPSQGLFTVGFEPWSGHASTVQVSVTDMAGRQVWQHSYQGVQSSLFTTNVDLRGQPKGVYLLRVQADAAQALQRVVVE